MKRKIKLAIFDMEGTIFKKTYRYDFIKKNFPENWAKLCATHGPEETWKENEFTSAWTFLCDILGPDASKKNKANWEKWNDGGYPGYSEWVIDTIKIHKEHGLTRPLFEGFIRESAEYFPGVAETFKELKSRGITIALVSGGLKAMADRVSREHKLDHCYAAADYYWEDDGTIEHWNVMPTDFAHKKGLVELLHHDLGFDREECAFIGDGRNDREVAGYCALSIGFNPHDELRHNVDVIIEQSKNKERLSAVFQPIIKYPDFALSDFREYKIWSVE